MKTWSAVWLCGLVSLSILTAFVPERWPVSILEIGSFLLALAWLVKLTAAAKPPRLSPILAPFAFFATWGILQLTLHWTVAGSPTLNAVLNWSAYLALVFSALQTFDEPVQVGRLLRWLLYFGIALAVVSTLQTFTSPEKVYWLFLVPDRPAFVMGPFLNHAHYSAFVEMLLPLALIPAVTDASKRTQYSLLAGVLVASVIASASRGGFAVVAIETVVVLWLCARKERRGLRHMGAALAAVAVLTAGLTVIVGWDALGKRFLTKDPSRIEMFYSSLDMIRDHGWGGVGLGDWPAAYPYYARYDDGLYTNQAHDDWAQWTAEGGILAFAAIAFLAVWTARMALVQVWCAGPLFVFAHATIDYPFQKPAIAAMAFLILGAAAAARNSPYSKRKKKA